MSSFPFMKFFPADWLADTRTLSLEARGAWIDLCCAMHMAPERGKLVWTTDQFQHFLGLDRMDATEVWNELIASGIGELEMHENPARAGGGVTPKAHESEGNVTLICRRMYREYIKRKQTLERVTRHRNAKSNAKVTDKKLEARSQKLELRHTDDPTKADMSVQEFVESWNEWFDGSLPKVEWPLSPSRAKRVRLRLSEHKSNDFWEKVFSNIQESQFLLGNGKGNWRCTMDFVIQNDTNAVKIYEGVYNGQGRQAG